MPTFEQRYQQTIDFEADHQSVFLERFEIVIFLQMNAQEKKMWTRRRSLSQLGN
jgi:hypothetical protein